MTPAQFEKTYGISPAYVTFRLRCPHPTDLPLRKREPVEPPMPDTIHEHQPEVAVSQFDLDDPGQDDPFLSADPAVEAITMQSVEQFAQMELFPCVW
jgi:hypothetical protein